MQTLCIVPCGKMKIWDKYPDTGYVTAREAYIGSYAKKCREYAEKYYPDSWCILSAKYGFLFPEDIVEGSYNVSFNDKKTNPIIFEELSVQVKNKKLYNYDTFVVLGGKNYVNMATALFQNKKILTPLSDCNGIGYMMKKINQMIESK